VITDDGCMWLCTLEQDGCQTSKVNLQCYITYEAPLSRPSLSETDTVTGRKTQHSQPTITTAALPMSLILSRHIILPPRRITRFSPS
jgi:hypothetical protein